MNTVTIIVLAFVFVILLIFGVSIYFFTKISNKIIDQATKGFDDINKKGF